MEQDINKAAFEYIKEDVKNEKPVKLTGDPSQDFPELNDDEDASAIEVYRDERTKENEYVKKAMIDEFLDNVEIKEDQTIYDKRLKPKKRPLLQRIFDVFFPNDTV